MRQLYTILILFISINTISAINTKTDNNRLNIEKKEEIKSINSNANNLALPTASITTNASSVCLNGTKPIITFNGIGGTAPYTFTYTINGGSNQTIVTSSGSSVTVSQPTATAGTFIYTLASVTDSSGTQVQTGTVTITVLPQPDATINGTGSGSSIGGVPVFKICSNSVSQFTITNVSSTDSTLNTNYTIDWGDGTQNFNSTTWSSLTHSYALGVWNLIYTIQSNNGCPVTKKYIVFVGNNPGITISNPGNTNICIQTPLILPITGTENNPPGTIYTVSYSDGSPPEVFDDAHPLPSSLSHTFLKTSCGTTSSNGFTSYPNAFSANIVAENPCGSSAVGVVPVYVSSPPVADFILPTNGCTSDSICIKNTSTGAYDSSGISSCGNSPKFVWQISPATGYTITSGRLGYDFGSNDPNLWTTGTTPLCVNFTQPGTYTITIETGNRCGYDKTTKTICIDAPLVPVFSLNTNSGCTPVSVSTTNSTITTNSCATTYLWNVTYSATNCGTSVVNPIKSTLINPTFNFVESGTYSITLTSTNACGSVVSAPQTVIVKQPPTAVINSITNVCQTLPTTSISPTATITNCGSQPLTYAWSFPNGTPSTSTLANPGIINYSTSGTYTVSLTVTNECGSTIATNQTFTINPIPILSNIPLTQVVCSGVPTTLVNLTSSPASTNFSWTATATLGISGYTPSGTSTIPVQTLSTTNANPGTVTYAITPSIGSCPGPTVNYVITVNPLPIITQPVSSSVCIGGTATLLEVTVMNGVGTPAYQWYSNILNSNSGGTPIPLAINSNYIPPTTAVEIIYYYCIITLPSGKCTSITSNTATVTITPLAIISQQPTPTQNICSGATTPLKVGYTGGTGIATYQWYSNLTNTNSGGTAIVGATTANFTPPVFNTAGSFYYYAEVSLSGNGCGSITSNPAEIIVVADTTVSSQPLPSQTLCQSSSPTDLTVTATGGIGTSYTYQWFSNSSNLNSGGILISGATNNTFTPPTLTVGTTYYYCEISKTGIGCTVTSATSTVIVILAPTISNQLLSSTVCQNETPTTLKVTLSGALGIPTYQWYSNSVNTIVGSNPVLRATNSSFSPPATAVGTLYYYCIITLPTSGCSNLTSNIAAVVVNQNPVISNKSAVICSGNSFTITPDNLSGDIVPVGTTYTWTNPTVSPANAVTGISTQLTQQTSISQILTNTTTSPATVTYTITPLSGGCPGVTFTIVITVNPSIFPNITLNNSTCYVANNGNIQTNIVGGVPFSSGPPYVISWSGPGGFSSTASSISNLIPGNYNLSIMDAGGCPFSNSYIITEPNDIAITTDLKKDITCFGSANGSIAITITGGTTPYNYTWTKNGIPFASIEDISNLSPGIYLVTVSDVNNCGPKTSSFTITEPPVLSVNFVSQTNILCFGDAAGAINVTAVGGTLPYTFAWTGPNGFISSDQNLTAILAGTYNLVVTDNSGCSVNLAPTIITQTPEIIITATTTPLICYEDNNASISIIISGGIAPYQILWSTMGNGTFQNNLSAGDYLITVTDALNCVKTLNVNIPSPPIFTINPVVKNITCFGDHNGTINLNIVGGIAPVKLVWEDSASAGNVRNNLGAGIYTVTITDSKPCTFKKVFEILEPQLLVLSANIINAFDCFNANSGAINLLVAGGSAPFTYTWSNGATTEDLVNIPAGNYMVTVTDLNGCSAQAQYSVDRPPPIVIGVQTNTDFNCETKSVKQTFVAQVSGGLPPYQLAWSSGTVSGVNNEIMNTSQNGTVILYATDALGCKANYTFNVDIPTLGTPSFTIGSYAFSTFGIYSIKDPIQFTNTATGNYISMTWDFGDGSISTDLNPLHTYVKVGTYVAVQTVTYPFGCVYTNTLTIKIEKGYQLIMPNGFTPNGDGINDTFKPEFKGLKSIELSVYDTWGELIYSENADPIRGWDGKIKGKESENGNYYYKISAITFYGDVINLANPFVLIK